MPEPSQKRAAPNNGSTDDAGANDEDWTKMTDFTERRRIQSRIAQRKYRELKPLIDRLYGVDQMTESLHRIATTEKKAETVRGECKNANDH